MCAEKCNAACDRRYSLCASVALSFKCFRSRLPKAIQGYSSLSKPIQGFFGKMILYFLPRRSFSEGGLGWHRGPGRDGELTPAAKLTQKQTK
jgi:hypothetical protein